ncbi:MAG: hypothetical protein AAF799_40410 [Myxococcota bacterium]
MPATPGAPAAPLRHRDLPVMMASELERMVGFVPIVRLLSGLVGVLGTLATAAGISMGLPALAGAAALLSGLILYALWEDTRLASALDLLRKRRTPAAEAALAKIASSPRRSAWQRQRARTYLASIAWRRGDVEQSLQWIQARLAVPRHRRQEPTEGWLAMATEVRLLALAGHVSQAKEALGKLPKPPPRDEDLEMIAAETALLVAFVADDADAVRDELDGWEPLVSERDGVGLGLALLAWANAGRGDRDRALRWVRALQSREDNGHLQRFYPRLWQWIERYDAGFHYGRK